MRGAVGLYLALAAVAGNPAGANLPPIPKSTDSASREQYHSLAKCLATVDWKLVKPLLDTNVGTGEERRILNQAVGHGKCQAGNLGEFWNTALRHDVAEARYRAVYSDARLPAAADDDLAIPEGAQFAWTAKTGNGPWQAFQALASCLSKRDAPLVHSVLISEEDSLTERERMATLTEHVGPCLRPGQKIRISTLELRSWLAEAQYDVMRTRIPDVEAAE